MNKFLRQIIAIWMAMFAALASSPVQSQYSSDIDVYGSPGAVADAPNVLIMMDNTANWSSAFNNEVSAMVSTLNSLTVNQFRVGFMMFTETGGGDTGEGGGYVRAAIRTLTSSYRTALNALLTSLDSNSDKSNSGKAGLTMAEAYYYFAGKAPFAGNNKNKTDYAGNTFGTTASTNVYGFSGNALTSKAGTSYASPVVSGCARNYIIYISNGPAQDSISDTTEASSRLSAAYSALSMSRPPDITGLTPNGSQSNVADEWARFMKSSPQGIAVYTVEVDPGTTGQGPGWTALLKSVAAASGGAYFAVDSSVGGGAQIADAVKSVFNQIQAVNSVFSSASLPISVNARGTYLNQIFMGMFRPDADGKTRWRGNLKQYQFGYDPTTDSVSLVDARGSSALSASTGFLSATSTSRWTHTSTFWVNQQLGTPPSSSDAPDGEVVEKGGVAQMIREAYASSQDSRKIYTCLDCAENTNLSTSTGALFSTSTSALTTTLLNVTTGTERTNLINWVRGADNNGDELGPGGAVTIRPSVHGDVLHSRPAVINYGTTTGVVVYYGSNDGLLRAVNGSPTGANGGQELWSFIAQEHLGKLNRQRLNNPEIRLSSTVVSTPTSSTSPLPRDYFADGPIGIYQKINAAGTTERAILYSSMRRGGRLIYALDVTNPLQPIFLWKLTNATTPVLGQTWSEPKVARIKGNVNPVIIMGAGYDNVAEDISPPGSTTMGNAVLVIDAINGTVLKQFSTTRSVAADVSVVDSDFDGFVDRAYAVDTGGNVYRVDLENGLLTATSNWSSYKLATLGTSSTVRKFFNPPDVVLSRTFTALLVGSGDREKPLARTSNDAFFTVYDTHLTKGTPTSTFTPITFSRLGEVGRNQNMTEGCYILMNTAGEKIVNAPTTVAGVTYFGTNMPNTVSAGSCTADLGIAKVYSAPLFCATATSQTLVGGGLPPSPVAGTVLVSYTVPGTNTTASKQVSFVIGAPNAKNSAIEGSKVAPAIVPTRKRRYWYIENPR